MGCENKREKAKEKGRKKDKLKERKESKIIECLAAQCTGDLLDELKDQDQVEEESWQMEITWNGILLYRSKANKA